MLNGVIIICLALFLQPLCLVSYQHWRGRFSAAGEQQFPSVTSVPLLELFAVRYGLQVAQQQGFQQNVVESDSMKAIAVLNGTCPNSSAIDTIAEDVLQFASNFSMARDLLPSYILFLSFTKVLLFFPYFLSLFTSAYPIFPCVLSLLYFLASLSLVSTSLSLSQICVLSPFLPPIFLPIVNPPPPTSTTQPIACLLSAAHLGVR
ncbi:hypothetical protein D8674_012802 [Pyrus ussuriensis x Pyrus communis]|uniref:RNase H type-1 domain-containing protein n=1 Tax=Pyrus ussuriensis x Pyrus communis TaxID=2448454 RepID=A0A5N5GQB9_9ROSA|nr:hypothetical protein D8674_012802 [Pyrus ussuriensis x Pyrus communis]